jgi:hypothetical protein
MTDERRLIGRKEHVALPEWGISRIRAKVDTGARSSALDVLGYDLWKTESGQLRVRFRLTLNRNRPDRYRVIEADVVRLVSVRNTSGVSEQRPLIDATIQLGTVTQRIRLTLTDRAAMRHRMILGRQALRGQFVVDVSKKYVLDG